MSDEIKFQLDARAASDMKRLIEICEFSGNAAAINSAMTFFEWAIGEVLRGRKIASFNEAEHTYETVEMPAFEKARAFGNSPA